MAAQYSSGKLGPESGCRQPLRSNHKIGTDDVRKKLLDFDAQSIGRRLQRLAFGNHFQNGVLKLKHAKAFGGSYFESACFFNVTAVIFV
jgi:hypothetical protein